MTTEQKIIRAKVGLLELANARRLRGGARPPARSVDTAPPASTNSPPPLTMVFLAMPPDLLCMGLFCKKTIPCPSPPRAKALHHTTK
jgi:hypothetical protein